MEYGQTFRIDDTGDLIITSLSNTEIISGSEKIAQDIRVILTTVKGSCAFNTDFGVDYVGLIHSKASESVIEAEIRRAILTHPAVSKVTCISATRGENRTVTVTAEVLFVNGESSVISAEVAV